MIDILHLKKIYIDFLEQVSKNQEEEQTRYANNYSLVLRDRLKRDFAYSNSNLNKARIALVKAGFLGESRSQLFITDAGKNYLKEHSEFLLLPITQSAPIILKNNIQTIVAVMLSVLTLIFLIHKHI